MPTIDEYLTQSVAVRLERLRGTPTEVAALLQGSDQAALARRPNDRNWSPTEVVCHRRDVEELFLVRFQTIRALDNPRILTFGATPEARATWGIGSEVGHPLGPDRWAEERQYDRQDPIRKLQASGRRRREVAARLDALSPEQWPRGGIHQARGRMDLGEWVASRAGHDDNPLGQRRRILDGRP